MKAIDINGTIKTYNSVPKTWGNIIGVNYMTDSELENLGFYDVEEPILKESQEYGAIEWDSENSQFTYPILNKTYSKTLTELKDEKIKLLKSLYNIKLTETDWMVIREAEGGTAMPSDIATERTNLRTDCATKESEINAKTTKAQVVDYELPTL